MGDLFREMTLEQFDLQLLELEQWILRAGEALLMFHNSESGVFWRDSVTRASRDSESHPTSTNRSFLALFELLRFMAEENLEKRALWKDAMEAAKNVQEKYFRRAAKGGEDLEWALSSQSNKRNHFTNAHFVLSLATLDRFSSIIEPTPDLAQLKEIRRQLVEEITRDLLEHKGSTVTKEIHDFVTLYCLKAVFSSVPEDSILNQLTDEIRDRVRDDVLAGC